MTELSQEIQAEVQSMFGVSLFELNRDQIADYLLSNAAQDGATAPLYEAARRLADRHGPIPDWDTASILQTHYAAAVIANAMREVGYISDFGYDSFKDDMIEQLPLAGLRHEQQQDRRQVQGPQL